MSRYIESNCKHGALPRERCRRKSDSGLYVKPVETDVLFTRLRQVERSLFLERERTLVLESEIKSQAVKVADAGNRDESHATAAAGMPEPRTEKERGM